MIDTLFLKKIVGREVKTAVGSEDVNTGFTCLNERLLILLLIHVTCAISPIMESDLPVFLKKTGSPSPPWRLAVGRL
jgi:hypothetical protein